MNYRVPKACCKAALLCLLLLAACRESGEGELEGKWQLRETAVGDESPQAVDTVWYNFQNTLFMYQLYDAARDTFPVCYGFTFKEGDSLRLELHRADYFLHYTDWAGTVRTFAIEHCSRRELTLASDEKRYYFHKF